MLFTFKDYEEGLERGELLGLLCNSCGFSMFPSQMACFKCGKRDLSIIKLNKEGVIKTFTVIRVSPTGFKAPYIVAMVRTCNNVHIMGNVINVNIVNATMKLISRKVSIEIQTKKKLINSNKAINIIYNRSIHFIVIK